MELAAVLAQDAWSVWRVWELAKCILYQGSLRRFTDMWFDHVLKGAWPVWVGQGRRMCGPGKRGWFDDT